MDQRTPAKHRITGEEWWCASHVKLNQESVLEKALGCETTILNFFSLSPSSMNEFSDFLQFSFFLPSPSLFCKLSVAKPVWHWACVSFSKPNWNQIPSRTVGATAFLCYRNDLLLKHHCPTAPNPNANSANWCLVSTVCNQHEKWVYFGVLLLKLIVNGTLKGHWHEEKFW